MLLDKKGIVFVMAALMTITAAAPIAGASTITTVVSPSTGSANVTAYVNTTATLSTNNTLLMAVLSLIGNNTGESNTMILTSGTQTFSDFQNALRENTSEATLSYLMIHTNYTSKLMSAQEIMVNLSMELVMNVTGIINNNTVDMGWRAFNTNKTISINNQDYNHVSIANQSLNSSSVLNFTAFSKPLDQWNSSYSAVNNETTFSTDAGFTLNYYHNTTSANSYANFTVKSDPSYSIMTPGYAKAGANTISISNPPSSSMSYIYYAIVVAIIVVGIGVAVASRRRK